MVIRILGPGCSRCNALESKVRNLLETHRLRAEVQKVTDIFEMINYGIARTPALVINERLKSSGVIPKDEQILQWLLENKYIEK